MRKQPDETAEIERVLIACALQDVEIAGRLTARVEPVMFAAANRGRCWSALAHVVANGPGRLEMIDAVAAELDRQSDASALAALHDLTDLVPAVGNKNADYFAERVADAHKRRKWRRWIRTAAIIYSVAFVALLLLAFEARWDKDLRSVLGVPFTVTVMVAIVGGGLVFNYGEAEDKGRIILTGIMLSLLGLGLIPAVWFWWWR